MAAIKFEIYRDGNRLSAFEPVGASAIGPESVPVAGEVTFRDGLLIVTRPDEAAAGLSLLWDLGAQGTYQLETTRLLPRQKPYVLNVELARFRLMKVMQKQEDWNLFDFPRTEKYAARFHEAQMTFADALGRLDEAGESAKLADRALDMGLDLSEQLAAFHADLLLQRRKASVGFVKHVFGCRIDPTVPNERYKEAAATGFDYAIVPMSWKQLQPQENAFNTQPIDDWIEFLGKRRVPTIAGPLVRLDRGHVPDWMVIWEHDFDALRDTAYEYVQKVVTRYRRAVSAWNVVAGLQTNASFQLTFEQIIDMTRLLVAQVKTVLPTARTLVTITHPFGEYHAKNRGSVPPLLYAEMVSQAGITFDGFGLELELGVPQPGMFMRDLFQVSSMLDRFATLGRPVFLTAVGVPGRAMADPDDSSQGRMDPSFAGRWRKPWDPALQAEWMEAVYQVALSKPFVESIAWANLADVNHTLPGGGLLDDMLRPKPAYAKLQQLREKYRGGSAGGGAPAPAPAPKKP
jgi:hypothetical protein